MFNGLKNSKKIVFLAIFLIILTVVYGTYIHDLLAVSWQRFVDFFFFLVLLASVFALVKTIYQKHFKYLNLTSSDITNMSHLEFVDLIFHLYHKMGYQKLKLTPNSFFDFTCEQDKLKYVIFCYHKNSIQTTPIIKNAKVILITDYFLESYELEKLEGSQWKLIQNKELLSLFNEYLV